MFMIHFNYKLTEEPVVSASKYLYLPRQRCLAYPSISNDRKVCSFSHQGEKSIADRLAAACEPIDIADLLSGLKRILGVI